MATMKTRIINNITTIISEYADLAGCEAQLRRLAELGAPQQLIDQAAARHIAMREELPRMVTYIKQNISHHTSLLNIILACGKTGFSEDALHAITPDPEVKPSATTQRLK